MITIICVMLTLVIALGLAIAFKTAKEQNKPLSAKQFNILLQNIEAYDGTSKGQKRLEDKK